MTAIRRQLVAAGALLVLAGAAVRPAGADPAAQVAEIWAQTVSVRGLEPRADPVVELLEREALRAQVATELLPADPGSRRLFVALGLLPPEPEPETLALDLLGAHATGMYSRLDKRVYLAGSESRLGPTDKLALAHELVHALQDQHFDLHRIVPEGADRDRRVAAEALVEGDAMLTMVRWGRRFLTVDDKLGLGEPERAPGAAELAEAPVAVRERVLFPYQQGRTFVQALHARGGDDAVNQAFLDPPISTEQVIHPDKYFAREGPRGVPRPPLAGPLGPTWRSVLSDVLGELYVRVLIEQFASPAEAEAVAAGWGGDSVQLLEDEAGRPVIALATAWDSDADAGEFYNAYGRGIARRFGTSLRRAVEQPSLSRWSTPVGEIQILKTGDQVVLIVAPTGQVLDVAAAQFR